MLTENHRKKKQLFRERVALSVKHDTLTASHSYKHSFLPGFSLSSSEIVNVSLNVVEL
jgi:hypothetical protein